MLLALLFRVGIKSENHTVSIILLEDLFEIDNKDIKLAKEERIDKQYYVNFKITKKETEDMISLTDKFRGQIDDLLSSLTSDKIKMYRKKFELLLI
jgi:uncharacterized protein (UPF0332 family)